MKSKKHHAIKKHHAKMEVKKPSVGKKTKMINPPYDEHEVMEKPAGHRVKSHATHTDDKQGKISNPGNTTETGKMGINSIGMLKELSAMHKKHHKDHMRIHKKYGKK